MAAWTKSDFDASYSFRVERHMGGHPNTRPEVRINYHEYFMRPIMVARWKGILPIITPAIDASDRVLIVGAGFGWGVKALRNRIGCSAIGTDTSVYIQAEKDSDDSVEIGAAARAKELVLNEDMSTQESRQAIGAALGGAPTWICTEDMVTDGMTDAEILTMVTLFDQSTAKKFWIYTPSGFRTAQDLATLTGHRVITTGTFELVAP